MSEYPPEIFKHFLIPEGNYDINNYGRGHINKTFLVKDMSDRGLCFILQRINNRVFTKPIELCQNTYLTTEHIHKKIIANPEIKYKPFELIKTNNELPYYLDEKRFYWRMLTFIPNSKTEEQATSNKIAYEAGKIIGSFQYLLADFDKDLFPVLPDFHNIIRRADEFNKAIKKNAVGRLKDITEEVDFALSRVDSMKEYFKTLTGSGIPERIIHNDTKLNNILFNNNDEALCLIDLDTVMPGYIHFDYGDAIRTLVNTTVEDDPDVKNVNFNQQYFHEFSIGYLKHVKSFITKEEKELLPFAPLYMTYIIGLRFLTDYLSGDKYYRINREDHNLARAKVQFMFLSILEKSQLTVNR